MKSKRGRIHKFPVGTKVWIKQKTVWDTLPKILGRRGNAPKPNHDMDGNYFGWVRNHKIERFSPNDGGGYTSEYINVVVYNKGRTTGGDYYRDSDLEIYDKIDFIPQDLFEI
jgi:hypothetical protein